MLLEKVEKFKNIVIDQCLPLEDFVLFGVLCPYCGKNDRIRPLEPPEKVAGELEKEVYDNYQELWVELLKCESENDGLAVCKFCQNVLIINKYFSAVKTL